MFLFSFNQRHSSSLSYRLSTPVLFDMLCSFLLCLNVSTTAAADVAVVTYDVVIIGAGSAGAGAAREFKKWNKANKMKNKIKYTVLEATGRIGGRIYDVNFGSGTDEKDGGVWGGFDDSNIGTSVGCNCNGIPVKDLEGELPAGCQELVVEVGAGWFTGDAGIKTECKPKDLFKKQKQNKKCDEKRPNINQMYQLAQGQGSRKNGKFRRKKNVLLVNCDSYDDEGPVGDFKFLNYANYYGSDDEDDDNFEMEPVNTVDKYLPSFNPRSGAYKDATAAEFLSTFEKSVKACVDPAALAFYEDWYKNTNENGTATSPEDWGAIGVNSTNWYVFDQTFSTVPDTSTVEWNDKKYVKKQRFCNYYKDNVQEYMYSDGTDQTNITQNKRANQLNQFYTRFIYDSEYLAEDLSFMNFGVEASRSWQFDINYSIDARGLSVVVKKIMPNNVVKFYHKVTNIDYTGTLCDDPEYPVLVTVIDTHDDTETTKHYCARKVISTVSIGVLQNKEALFEPKINALNSPYEKMGNLIKLYLRFPTKFWHDGKYLTYVMTEDFRKNYTDNTIKSDYLYNLPTWFKNLETDDSKPGNTDLFMFLSSPDISFLGLDDPNITDEFIANKVWRLLEPLRKQYGNNYTDPNCFYYYNWGLDTNQYGAYGVWAKGKTYFDFVDFYKPLTLGTDSSNDVVWLSGEHSCMYHWGFIEGAYEAGSRDARFVIKDIMGEKASDISTFSACGLQRGNSEDYCL